MFRTALLLVVLSNSLIAAPAPLSNKPHRYPIPSPVGRWTLDGVYEVTMYPDGRYIAATSAEVWYGTWRLNGKQLFIRERRIRPSPVGDWGVLECPWPTRAFVARKGWVGSR